MNIVLFEPEIPQNTGNIGRLCVGLDICLHLIEPLGFDISDKMVKRSGLDYWKELDLITYVSWNDFLDKNRDPKILYASTKPQKTIYETKFSKGCFVVFGKETGGLPQWFHNQYKLGGFTIPMPGAVRSINLSNSVAVVAYEAFRQLSG
ncbi:MAG: tRNA (uridine(34)/cytosine(34)/5-carboxymethylaminomethyluridine(34)-2'-O)-methyltransferase TrmL [Candidatus Cloacimonadota bacterium]|nr:MAG: tRNA (uridine(34)/cytosine(34)/5-carboxymethylaminomethyluridine(34)-2'-O)-methyltransferase TrmL [Candidatus Cloacimonadota bacterium]PIE79349.1 MAG: tRNA (uridine(34)/cytosine(34)/5-carboxymethylaminomethyluridine(34)-2'-O)-methyltransferase TrmL [Candidatus Delongbacteria bacterium]